VEHEHACRIKLRLGLKSDQLEPMGAWLVVASMVWDFRELFVTFGAPQVIQQIRLISNIHEMGLGQSLGGNTSKVLDFPYAYPCFT
jgi:hypothetical protein